MWAEQKLPEGWTKQTIAQLGNHSPTTVQTGPFGAQLHSKDYVDEGVPFILIRNLQENGLDTSDMPHITYEDARRLSLYRLEPGDIVFSRVGRVGSCFLVGEEQASWVISGQMLRIRLPEDSIDRRYLIHAIRSKPAQDQITGASVGSTRKSINTQILESLNIVTPPLPEQRRIAEILDAADEAIRQTERLIAKLKAVKAGLLHDLLTCGLDEHGHLRGPQAHPEQFKDSSLGRIPREWQVRRLGEFGEFKNGLNKGKEDFGFGTKFVNISDVYLPRLDTDNLGRMNATSLEVESYRLEVGDILFDRSSVKLAGVGYPTVFEGADEPIIFCGFIIRFRMLESIAEPIFLCEQMRDELFRNRVFQIATRSANVNVNQEQLSKLQVVLPPVQEQEAIITILDIHNARIRVEEAELAKLRQVKRGLMDDLLTGKVRLKL